MKQEKVVLVVGADGLIGRSLVKHLLLTGKQVIGTTRRRDTITKQRIFLDLSKDISRWNPKYDISVAYICAGVSSIERCRKYATQSMMVNIYNTVELSKTLIKRGTFVIFLSTNLVYDGSVPFRMADDTTCPLSEYGKQKAEAERRLLALGELISVVRFSKILAPEALLFNKWIRSLHNGEIIYPFSDMVMAPIPLTFAIDVLCCITDVQLSGISQISGERDVTYEEVARYIAQHIGANEELIQPIRANQSGIQLDEIPKYSTLDVSRLRIKLGMEPPDVWSTVDMILEYSELNG